MVIFFVLFTVISTLSSSAAQAFLPTEISGLNLTTGQTSRIDLNSHEATIAIFLSIKCPSSKSHLPLINELAKKWKKFQFVGIHSNVDEDVTSSQKFFQKLNLNFPVIQDEKAVLADKLKAFKTPHVFILKLKHDLKHNTSAANEVEILYRGGVTESYLYSVDEKADDKSGNKKRNYLREALEDLDQKKSLRTTETRTLGCAIARE